MGWKDRVGTDPHGSLEKSAARRGLSVDELKARRDKIANALGGQEIDEHLTLNELYLFSSDPERLSQVHYDHLDSCDYCKTLNGALSPQAVRERTKNVSEGSAGWAPIVAMTTSSDSNTTLGGSFSRWQVAGVAAAIPLLVIGLLLGSGTLRVESNAEQIDQLRNLSASYLALSEELPENLGATSAVSLISAQDFPSALMGAACSSSIPTVSHIGPNKVELSWSQVSKVEIPSYCSNKDDLTASLSNDNITSHLSVGQPVMLMTPPVTEGNL